MSKNVWDDYWEKNLNKRRLFGYLTSLARNLLIANYMKFLVDKYFSNNGLFLEAGSGTSQTSSKLSKFGRRYIALDYSYAALKKATNVEVIDYRILGDIFSLPFSNLSLDGIWNIGVMEHFNENDLIKIYTEFARVLKKDGKIIVLIPPVFASHVIVLTPIEWFISLFKKQPFHFFPEEPTRLKGKKHIYSIINKTKLKIINTHFCWRDFFFFYVVVAEPEI